MNLKFDHLRFHRDVTARTSKCHVTKFVSGHTWHRFQRHPREVRTIAALTVFAACAGLDIREYFIVDDQ